MSRRLLVIPAVAAFLFLAGIPTRVAAQDDPAAFADDQGPPAHVSFVEGTATLERDGRSETAPLNMPLLGGDRLRTASGRVEVMFADGSTLHLDADTSVDFESDEVLRLTDGRVRLSLPASSRDVSYRIDSPAGSVRIVQPGEYRIALLHGDAEIQLELAVSRGAADIFTDEGSTPVRAGQRAYASAGLAPSYPYDYNAANWDEFDRWSETRRDVRAGVSTQYLPGDLRTYAPVFDEYGSWNYEQPYGYVWYPRVAAGWRPYYYGRWASYPRYGWTWIGADIFSWPTHHYGRWGFRAGVWFWIPARHWAPAHVSWAYAPGYVSWCPLGFDVGPRFYSPWRAWTAIPSSHFGRGYVHTRVVAFDRVDARQRPSFVVRPTAPLIRDVAVARGTAPIRWAGVPRGSAVDPRGVSSRDARGTVAVPQSGVRAGAPVPRGSAGVRGDTRDNYFIRGGVAGEHVVPRTGTSQFPSPARPPRDIRTLPPPARAAERAVPPPAIGGGNPTGAPAQPQVVPRRPGATIYGPGRSAERRYEAGSSVIPRRDPAVSAPERRGAPTPDAYRGPIYGRPNRAYEPSAPPESAPRTRPGAPPFGGDRAIDRRGGRGFGSVPPPSQPPVMHEPARREPSGGIPMMRAPMRRESAAPPPPPPPQHQAPAARPSGGSPNGRGQAVPRGGGH